MGADYARLLRAARVYCTCWPARLTGTSGAGARVWPIPKRAHVNQSSLAAAAAAPAWPACLANRSINCLWLLPARQARRAQPDSLARPARAGQV